MRDDKIDLQSPTYTPRRLLNEVMWVVHADNRNQMACLLELDNGLVSRIWNRQAPLSSHVLMRIMDCLGWGAQYVRELAGMPFDGTVYPPRPRILSKQQRNYQLAKADILQAMPGTVEELVQKSGWALRTVREWLGVLRAGDPHTRASHIVGWVPQASRPGPPLAIHAAGPGEDALRIVPRIRGVRAKKSRCDIGAVTA
jgi:hypothetical protein